MAVVRMATGGTIGRSGGGGGGSNSSRAEQEEVDTGRSREEKLATGDFARWCDSGWMDWRVDWRMDWQMD